MSEAAADQAEIRIAKFRASASCRGAEYHRDTVMFGKTHPRPTAVYTWVHWVFVCTVRGRAGRARVAEGDPEWGHLARRVGPRFVEVGCVHYEPDHEDPEYVEQRAYNAGVSRTSGKMPAARHSHPDPYSPQCTRNVLPKSERSHNAYRDQRARTLVASMTSPAAYRVCEMH